MDEKIMKHMTISVTKEEYRALKLLAVDRDTNVSAMIRAWLAAELEKAGDGEEDA